MLSNLPNLLSLIRLTLSPLLLFIPQEYLLLLFLPLALSDALDGFLARKLKAQTELGRVLDPLADKVMLLCGLFVCTFKLHLIPQALLYAVLARDLFLLLGGAILAGRNKSVPQARAPGKAFTFTLSLFILLCLGGFFSEPILWATIIMLFLSWADYFLFGLRALRSQTSSLS
ncbi:MAG: CDP-alcohol phosphatidyltransferase family protein [Aquificaceae bacterium]|uniref:CDP-alcohol phosphatidyltransferase family protein n=1 Tax=Hydrogenobacter sp. Uz 6-8 TaxID=3384828 RepID=UPI0030972C96